jgi:hypothetical protein
MDFTGTVLRNRPIGEVGSAHAQWLADARKKGYTEEEALRQVFGDAIAQDAQELVEKDPIGDAMMIGSGAYAGKKILQVGVKEVGNLAAQYASGVPLRSVVGSGAREALQGFTQASWGATGSLPWQWTKAAGRGAKNTITGAAPEEAAAVVSKADKLLSPAYSRIPTSTWAKGEDLAAGFVPKKEVINAANMVKLTGRGREAAAKDMTEAVVDKAAEKLAASGIGPRPDWGPRLFQPAETNLAHGRRLFGSEAIHKVRR